MKKCNNPVEDRLSEAATYIYTNKTKEIHKHKYTHTSIRENVVEDLKKPACGWAGARCDGDGERFRHASCRAFAAASAPALEVRAAFLDFGFAAANNAGCGGDWPPLAARALSCTSSNGAAAARRGRPGGEPPLFCCDAPDGITRSKTVEVFAEVCWGMSASCCKLLRAES